jgi:Ala-tRNA(Pro) deacylase
VGGAHHTDDRRICKPSVSSYFKGLGSESGTFVPACGASWLAFAAGVRYPTGLFAHHQHGNAMPETATITATTLPTSPQQLLARLDALGIAYRNHEHDAVFTVDEAKALRGKLQGGHIKNLFLRNKKEEMWLVVAEEDKRIDLKSLGEHLGAGKLSFGSADRLLRYLGVLPGAVTPFSIINDTDRKVTVVLDQDLMGFEVVNGHPLVNTMTTALSPQELLRFLRAEGHEPLMLDL